MVHARTPNPNHPAPGHPQPTDPPAGFGGRFNVLLTEDRDRPVEHWTRQLPRLIEPLGIHTHIARSAPEALELHAKITFHAAVVDLATPSGPLGGAPSAEPNGGLWLLKVLRRSQAQPPVVVVNSRATQRQATKLLNEALRLGAFSVVNPPVQIERLLGSIQRLIERRYAGQWPSPPSDTPPPAPPNVGPASGPTGPR